MRAGRYQRRPDQFDCWRYDDHVSMPKWLLEACEAGRLDHTLGGAALLQPDHQEGPRILIIHTKWEATPVAPGEWIVRDRYGAMQRYTDEDFKNEFEPVT